MSFEASVHTAFIRRFLCRRLVFIGFLIEVLVVRFSATVLGIYRIIISNFKSSQVKFPFDPEDHTGRILDLGNVWRRSCWIENDVYNSF